MVFIIRLTSWYRRPGGSLLYGYHFDFDEDGSKSYLLGAELPEGKQVPDKFAVLYVPSQTYAVFDSRVMN